MIVHFEGTDTRVDFEWTTDDDVPIVISDSELLVDDVDRSSLLTVTDGLIALHIPFDDAITVGNHAYSLRANDGTDWTLLSGGLLRVKALF